MLSHCCLVVPFLSIVTLIKSLPNSWYVETALEYSQHNRWISLHSAGPTEIICRFGIRGYFNITV